MANVIYTTKYSFSAGEVSELTLDRLDLERTKKMGCKLLRNMIVLPQGPVTRRSGFQFIHSITDLGLHTTDKSIRLEKFVFNKTQTYCLVFFKYCLRGGKACLCDWKWSYSIPRSPSYRMSSRNDDIPTPSRRR